MRNCVCCLAVLAGVINCPLSLHGQIAEPPPEISKKLEKQGATLKPVIADLTELSQAAKQAENHRRQVTVIGLRNSCQSLEIGIKCIEVMEHMHSLVTEPAAKRTSAALLLREYEASLRMYDFLLNKLLPASVEVEPSLAPNGAAIVKAFQPIVKTVTERGNELDKFLSDASTGASNARPQAGGTSPQGTEPRKQVRMWTDVQNRKVQARLSHVEGEMVVLEVGQDGKKLKLPLARLSPADRDYIAKHRQNN